MKEIISIIVGAFMLVAVAGLTAGCSMFKKKETASQLWVPIGGTGSISTGSGIVGH
jgi:hypothetical protein